MLKRNGKVAMIVLAVTAAVASSGCAANLYPGGPSVAGSLYTNVTDPAQNLSVAVDTSAHGTKRGTASASAILGLVATGDSSVNAAMKAGGIAKVHHVDHRVELILGGIYASTTTLVYGE